MIGLIRLYQMTLSPLLHLLAGPGYGCRYEPTCSEYAAQVIDQHGPRKGGWMAFRRLMSCHPFSK